MQSEKYYLYARKSTDVEDKQVLSIEAQLVELREHAKREGLSIADEFVEKRSAKVTGRPVFGKLLAEIEKSGGNILAWHPDRLARNSVDGGQIIYLLDNQKLGTLKFPSFWFENTSQGKFMLSIAFGQSKYYVDNLSENTKRGLRQKVRRGEYPSIAPFGYLNDIRNKTIIIDKRRAPIVIEAFELYARGDQTLESICIFLKSKNITTKSGKQIPKDQAKKMLRNPFYYGHFRYGGEVHAGKHAPIISKKLFDKVQATLARRGHKTKGTIDPQIFCGLLRCNMCNMRITAEKKTKHQKNGNVHEYVYYRCTRKNKTIKCTEPAVTELDLLGQLTDILQGYALPKSWATQLEIMLAADERQAEQSSGVFIADAQNKIGSLQSKLQRLLDSYLDQDIDRTTYQEKQSELMSEKKSLEEQIGKLTLAANAWVEPMRQWLKQATDLKKIAENAEPSAIKDALVKIEGLNLFLKSKKVQPTAARAISPPSSIWVSLRKTKEKSGEKRPKSLENPFLVQMRGLEPPRPEGHYSSTPPSSKY